MPDTLLPDPSQIPSSPPPVKPAAKEAGKPEKEGKKAKKGTPVFNPIDTALICVVVAALLGTGFQIWRIQTGTSTDTPVQAATPTPIPLPSLSLHQNHVRQGPPVNVNPSDIGKADPFN